MRTQLVIAALVLALGSAASSQAISAAPCKDAKGKFIKCAAPVMKPAHCKDAKGKFIKCPK